MALPVNPTHGGAGVYTVRGPGDIRMVAQGHSASYRGPGTYRMGAPAQAYDWLAPRNPADLTRQATATIRSAYGPAFSELDTEESKINAVAQKRQQDDAYYRNWMQSNIQSLQSQSQQALSTLDHASNGGIYQQGMNETLQNNYAYLASRSSDASTQTWNALQDVLGARRKLTATLGSDIAKEIARLQGVEISKAQSNRDYLAVTQKLGLQAAGLTEKITHDRHTEALGLTKAQQAQANSDRTYQLDVKKYGLAAAKDLYERQHGLGSYRPGGTGSASGGLKLTSQTKLLDGIDAAAATWKKLLHQGFSSGRIYQAMITGGGLVKPGAVKDKNGRYRSSDYYTFKPMDTQLAVAAQELVQQQYLSDGTINALRHRGVHYSTISARGWNVNPNYQGLH